METAYRNDRIQGLQNIHLELSSSLVQCESKVAVAEGRGQFGNQKEGERPPLEAVTRGLVKRQETENKCVL
jgi:hypothetical protein